MSHLADKIKFYLFAKPFRSDSGLIKIGIITIMISVDSDANGTSLLEL